MMKCSHPLRRNGSSQRNRTSKHLLPASVELDRRKEGEFLKFAFELGKLLKYYDRSDTVDGDWQCFFSASPVATLALVAAIDLSEFDDKYCQAEVKLWEDLAADPSGSSNEELNKQNYKALIICIRQLALKIHELCVNLPDELDLKKEVVDVIKKDIVGAVLENKIKNALVQLIEYDKGSDPPATEKEYHPFIASSHNGLLENRCTEAWGIGDLASFHCIPPDNGFREPFDPDKCNENVKLRALFMVFFQALKRIKERAAFYFSHELMDNEAHPPHLSLYLAFVRMFKYLQNDYNGLVGRHLDHYYQRILGQSPKEERPDSVYLLFGLQPRNENLEVQLSTDTQADAKSDEEGNPRRYAIDREIVLNQAKVEEVLVNYLFVDEQARYGGVQKAIFAND